MARGPLYAPQEDRALTLLYQRHRSNWEHHVGDYPQLAGRSVGSLKYRLYKDLGLGQSNHDEATARLEQSDWPAPGVILFHDDPRAIRDYGSPGRVTPADVRSMSGCSAAWAAQL